MDGRKWIDTTERYLSESGLNAVKKSIVPRFSVAVSCIGSDMGKAVLVKRDSVTNQQINTILIDSEKWNPEYIYYLLTTKQQFLKDIAGGSATPILNKGHFGKVEIEVLSKDLQDKAASILSAFDEKIRINTQTNQTLEQIAQAIFKSWFVDFEPVKTKIAVLEAGGTAELAELAAMSVISGKDETALKQLQAEHPEQYAELAQTAALFSSAMVESELGEIPEGWGVTDFGSVSECFDRKRIPLSKRQREKKQGNIPYYGATSIMDYVDEAIFDDIYLLLGEDGSVLKKDGTPFVQYIWGPSWVNNHAHVLQGSNGISTEQLMLFISMQNITAYVTGAVQLKFNQKNMNSIPFIKASDSVNASYQRLIEPLYEEIRTNSIQNKALVEIRDSLLPRLLSSKISVSEVAL